MKKPFLLVLLTFALLFSACGKKTSETENVEETVVDEEPIEIKEDEADKQEEPEEEIIEESYPYLWKKMDGMISCT